MYFCKGKGERYERYYNKRDNKEIYREHIKSGNGAVIMPFLDDNTLIMIEEVRTPIEKSILAFPAGLIEEGEKPADAAGLENVDEMLKYVEKTIGSKEQINGRSDYAD